MFAKLCVVAAILPLALGLTINAPLANVTSGVVTTISWSATASDTSFSIELFHPSFNNAFALANNVDPSLGSISVEMPIVPADSGYTLEAVNIGNISDVFSTSPSFSIAPTPSTGVSATASTTFTNSGSTTGAAASTTATTPGSTPSGTSGSSASNGNAGSSASNGNSGSSSSNTATSPSTSTTGTSSFNGAMSFKSGNAGPVVALLAAVAGATVFL